jgi:hypothetical protein
MFQASQTPFVWWPLLFVIRSLRFGMDEFFSGVETSGL